jgi:hypothetical protein
VYVNTRGAHEAVEPTPHRRRRARLPLPPRWSARLVLAAAVAIAVVVLLVAVTAAPKRRQAGGGPPASPIAAGASTALAGLPANHQAEATANTVSGSASVSSYPGASGGKVVKSIGDFGLARGPGVLRFNDIRVPVGGAYAVTVYYVHPDSVPNRTMVLTTPDTGAITETVVGSSICCTAQTFQVLLDAGTNTITFGNPRGHAPAIDKIVISVP